MHESTGDQAGPSPCSADGQGQDCATGEGRGHRSVVAVGRLRERRLRFERHVPSLQEGAGNAADLPPEWVPDNLVDDLREGWIDYYWTPPRKYLKPASE